MDASQRSSLFPWDNAGPSSSVTGAAGRGRGVRLSVDRPDIRMRGSSQSRSRRESSLGPNSAMGIVGFSPSIGRRGSQLNEEDFAFDGRYASSGTDLVFSDFLSSACRQLYDRRSIRIESYSTRKEFFGLFRVCGCCFSFLNLGTDTPLKIR